MSATTVPDSIPLPRLPSMLRELIGGDVPTYQVFWRGIVDGRLPAQQRNGRHFVHRADLPVIAAAFGLPVPSEPQGGNRP